MNKIYRSLILLILIISFVQSEYISGKKQLIKNLVVNNYEMDSVNNSLTSGDLLYMDLPNENYNKFISVPQVCLGNTFIPSFYRDTANSQNNYISFLADDNIKVTLFISHASLFTDDSWKKENEAMDISSFINPIAFKNGVDTYIKYLRKDSLFTLAGNRKFNDKNEMYLLFVEEDKRYNPVKINFIKNSLSNNIEYLIDSGNVYQENEFGYSYGWNELPQSGSDIENGIYDSYLTIENTNKWGIKLDDGIYKVKIYYNNDDSNKNSLIINNKLYEYENNDVNLNRLSIFEDYITISSFNNNLLIIENDTNNITNLYSIEIEPVGYTVVNQFLPNADTYIGINRTDACTESEIFIKNIIDKPSFENIALFSFNSIMPLTDIESAEFSVYINDFSKNNTDSVTLSLYAVNDSFFVDTLTDNYSYDSCNLTEKLTDTLKLINSANLISQKILTNLEIGYLNFDVKNYYSTINSEASVVFIIKVNQISDSNSYVSFLSKEVNLNKPKIVINTLKNLTKVTGTINHSYITNEIKLNTIDGKEYNVSSPYYNLTNYDKNKVELYGYVNQLNKTIYVELIIENGTVLPPVPHSLTAPTWSNNGIITWNWDGDETVTEYKHSLDSTSWTKSDKKTFTNETSLAEKVHTFYLKAKSSMSAWSDAITNKVTVDKTGPVVSTIKAVEAQNGSYEISWICTDNFSKSDEISMEYLIVHESDTNYANNINYSWQATNVNKISYLIEPGENKIYIKAKDAAGNETITTKMVYIPTESPIFKSVSVDLYTNNPKPIISWVCEDGDAKTVVADIKYHCLLVKDDTLEVANVGNHNFSSFTPVDSLDNGIYKLTITAMDTDSNSTTKNLKFVVDKISPVIKSFKYSDSKYSWNIEDQEFPGNKLTSQFKVGETGVWETLNSNEKEVFALGTLCSLKVSDRAGNITISTSDNASTTLQFGRVKITIPDSAIIKDSVNTTSRSNILNTISVTEMNSQNRASDTVEIPGSSSNVRLLSNPFQCLPHMSFAKDISMTLPYDSSISEDEYSRVMVFYYDEDKKKWEPVESEGVKPVEKEITCKTNHFSFYAVGVLNLATEPPQAQGINTKAPVIEPADPMKGIREIAPPVPNNRGSAIIHYPFNVPKALVGPTPSLSLTYNSEMKKDYDGYGWNLNESTIKIDTRRGVPKYGEGYFDNNTFMLDGKELVHIGDGKFRLKIDTGEFLLVEFKTDEGRVVVSYPDGTKYYYGNGYDYDEKDVVYQENNINEQINDIQNIPSVLYEEGTSLPVKNYLEDGVYYVKEKIDIAAKTKDNSNVKAYAGKEVNLLPGFETGNNSFFEAGINYLKPLYDEDVINSDNLVEINTNQQELDEFFLYGDNKICIKKLKNSKTLYDYNAKVNTPTDLWMHTFEWKLDRIEDASGNKVIYEYANSYGYRNFTILEMYPKEIRYSYVNSTNSHLINLKWNEKLFSFQGDVINNKVIKDGIIIENSKITKISRKNFISGFEITEKMRLDSVIMYYNNKPINSYKLEYEQKEYWHNVLSNIKEYSYNNNTEHRINSHSFKYKNSNKVWVEIDKQHIDVVNSLPGVGEYFKVISKNNISYNYKFMDINGDGKKEAINISEFYRHYDAFNDNGYLEKGKEITKVIDINNDGRDDLVVTHDDNSCDVYTSNEISTNNYQLQLNSNYSTGLTKFHHLIDINNDGFLDKLLSRGAYDADEPYETIINGIVRRKKWRNIPKKGVCLNTGLGWANENTLLSYEYQLPCYTYDDYDGNRIYEFWNDLAPSCPSKKYGNTYGGGNDAGVKFVDLNGDGNLDIVQYCYVDLEVTKYTPTEYKMDNAWIWTEQGWELETNYRIPKVLVEPVIIGEDYNVRFIEMNGDGLTDLLIEKKAYINNGNGWSRAQSFDLREDLNFNSLRFIDLTGNGLKDIVCRNGENFKRTYINGGNGWGDDDYEIFYLDLNINGRVDFSDVNGDGVSDFHCYYYNDVNNAIIDIHNSWETKNVAMTMLEIVNDCTSTSTKLGYKSLYKGKVGSSLVLDTISWGHINASYDNSEYYYGDNGRPKTIINYSNPIYDEYNKEFRGFKNIKIRSEDRIKNDENSDVVYWDITEKKFNNETGDIQNDIKYYQYNDNMIQSIVRRRGKEIVENKVVILSDVKKLDSISYSYQNEFWKKHRHVFVKKIRKFHYNDNGDLIANGDFKKTEYLYNSSKLPLRKIEHYYGDPFHDNDNTVSVTNYQNDDVGWLSFKKEKIIEDDNGLLLSKKSWDYDGRKIIRSNEHIVENGNVINELNKHYKYDSYGNIISVIDKKGLVVRTEFEYENESYSVNIIDPLGMSFCKKYNIKGELISETDKYGENISYQYDEYGRLESVKYKLKNMTDEIDIAENEYFKKKHDKWGTLWMSRSGVIDGRLNMEDAGDVNWLEANVVKDAFGRNIQMQKKIIDPYNIDTKVWFVSGRLTRDDMGRVIEIGKVYTGDYVSGDVNLIENSSSNYNNRFSYDNFGRVKNVHMQRSNDANSTINYDINIEYEKGYNSNEENEKECNFNADNGFPRILRKTIVTELVAGKVKRKFETYKDINDDIVIERKLNSIENLNDWVTTRYKYKLNGESIVEGPMGNVGIKKANSLGQLYYLKTPDAGLTTYEYDEYGNLEKILKQGKTIQNGVNGIDQIRKEINYCYDNFNRVKNIYFYNKGINDPESESVHYIYYPVNSASDYNNGRIKSISKGNYNEEYKYGKILDNNSHSIQDTIKVTKTIDNVEYSTTYKYDFNGRLDTLRLPNNYKIEYQYDNGGNLNAINYLNNDNSSEKKCLRNIRYNLLGQRKSCQYGKDLEVNYSYDENSNLLKTMDVGEHIKYQYHFNANGTLKSIHDNPDDKSTSQVYGYDDLGRIRSAVGNASYFDNNLTTKTYSYNENYEFDKSDRIVNKTNNRGESIIYNYNENNHSIQSIATSINNHTLKLDSLIYDDFGNLVKKIKSYRHGNNFYPRYFSEYSYNTENRIVSYSHNSGMKANYNYDYKGNRIKKLVFNNSRLTEKTIYVNAFYNINGNTPAIHISDGVNVIATIPNNDTTKIKFYSQNNIGSTVMVTDNDGNKIHEYLYKPFGEQFINKSYGVNSGVDRKFTGQEYDQESGLYYMNARYYDPETGIFLRPDPAMDGLNHYGYVKGNPITYIDPTGMFKTGVVNPNNHIYMKPILENMKNNNEIASAFADVADGTIGNPSKIEMFANLLNPSTNHDPFHSIKMSKYALQKSKDEYINEFIKRCNENGYFEDPKMDDYKYRQEKMDDMANDLNNDFGNLDEPMTSVEIDGTIHDFKLHPVNRYILNGTDLSMLLADLRRVNKEIDEYKKDNTENESFIGPLTEKEYEKKKEEFSLELK